MEQKNFNGVNGPANQKFYAHDFKNNKRSELFNTTQEAYEYAREWNRNGGFALVFGTTEF